MKKQSHTSGRFVPLVVMRVALLLAAGVFGVTTIVTASPPLPDSTGAAQTDKQSAPEPTGLELRWYDPFRPGSVGRVVKVEWGMSPESLSQALGLSDCKGKVCFLSELATGPGWFANFGEQFAGSFPVTVLFANNALYAFEINFLSGHFDYLGPKLAEVYGQTSFAHSAPDRDQEIREWQVDDVKLRLQKRWHMGSRDSGSLTLCRVSLSPDAPESPKLPF